VIYAGTSYSIAALEIMVHANSSRLPKRLKYVHADIPDDLETEDADTGSIPGWDGPDLSVAQSYGRAWLEQRRSLVLTVPSVVTRGLDQNALVNPLHPDFPKIVVSPEMPVSWDPRLGIQLDLGA
jgi:RES domain-containing protein